jgi:hypothetical protein
MRLLFNQQLLIGPVAGPQELEHGRLDRFNRFIDGRDIFRNHAFPKLTNSHFIVEEKGRLELFEPIGNVPRDYHQVLFAEVILKRAITSPKPWQDSNNSFVCSDHVI